MKRKRAQASVRRDALSSIRSLLQGCTVQETPIDTANIVLLPDFVQTHQPTGKSLEVVTADPNRDGIRWRLQNTLVLPMSTSCFSTAFPPPTCQESVSSLLDGVLLSLQAKRDRALLFRASKKGKQRTTYRNGNVLLSESAGTNNPNVLFWKTSIYGQVLHEWVGDDLIRALMLHSCLFVPVPNHADQLVQICGPRPMPPSKVVSDAPKASSPFALLDPHANLACRPALMYSSSYIPRIGLGEKTHILNRKDTTPLQLLTAIFNLPGIHKIKRKAWARSLQDQGLPLCTLMLENHRKRLDYPRIVEHYCPLPRAWQADVAELAHWYTPWGNVASACKAMLKRLIPMEMWGSECNFCVILGKVDQFMQLRQKETFLLKTLMHGVKTRDMKWLYPVGTKKKRKISRQDQEKVTNLCGRFLQWVFRKIVVPFLRCNFYITETEFGGKQLFFYRKPVWARFRNTFLATQGALAHYQPVTAQQVLKETPQRQFGVSQLRLLPKDTGVRPINQLSRPMKRLRRSWFGQEEHEDAGVEDATGRPRLHVGPTPRSANSVLRSAFSVLRHEFNQKPSSIGAGLDGMREFYPRYRRFISSWRRCRSALGKRLILVSVDIQKCYDRIHQQRLFEVIQQHMESESYVLKLRSVLQHGLRKAAPGEARWKTSKKVCSVEDTPPALLFQTGGAYVSSEPSSPSITVESGHSALIRQRDLIETLSEHVQSNVLTVASRYGPKFLRQIAGIPQGSVLSTLLCNLYLGDVQEELTGVCDLSSKRSPSCFLVRQVDDFLYIGTDVIEATEFLRRVYHGIPELGVSINSKKTCVSQELTVPGNRGSDPIQLVPRDNFVDSRGASWLPWCGFLVSVDNGQVRWDYSRFWGRNKVRASLTVEAASAAIGPSLLHRWQGYCRPRCLGVLMDPRINNFETIVGNYYQMMLFGVVKMIEYLRCRPHWNFEANVPYLMDVFRGVHAYTRGVIGRELASVEAEGNEVEKQARVPFHLSEFTTEWVCWTAMHDVLCTIPQVETKAWPLAVQSYRAGLREKAEDPGTLSLIASRFFQEIHIERLLAPK